MLLLKLPMPFPSLVRLSKMVGFVLKLQHTPLAVTVAPPLLVISPPQLAVVCVVLEIEAVVNTGSVAGWVENETLFP